LVMTVLVCADVLMCSVSMPELESNSLLSAGVEQTN
jgi:hypothetical protein